MLYHSPLPSCPLRLSGQSPEKCVEVGARYAILEVAEKLKLSSCDDLKMWNPWNAVEVHDINCLKALPFCFCVVFKVG